MKKITILTLLMTLALSASAISLPDSLNYTVRLGYNIGGTAPIGMPATIRKMNKFYFKPNFSLGIDVQRDMWGSWGLLTGLHLENKAMKIDATVKNYHMEMTKDGDRIEGVYTGNLVTECEEWMLTVPVNATFRTGNVLLKCGPTSPMSPRASSKAMSTTAICARATPPAHASSWAIRPTLGEPTISATRCAICSWVSTSVPTGSSTTAGASMPTWRGASRAYTAVRFTPSSRHSIPSSAPWVSSTDSSNNRINILNTRL